MPFAASLPGPAHGFGVVLTVLGYLIPLVLVPHILLTRRDRGSTVAWVVFIILVPYVGAISYWILGHQRLARLERRAQGAQAATRLALAEHGVFSFGDPDLEAIARVALRCGGSPPLGGNAVRIFDDNRSAFDVMLRAIDSARTTVELEVYIFRPDKLGRRFVAALTRAARRGVRVRLLVDGVGSFSLSLTDVRALERAGGAFATFLPVLRPRWRPRINFRLHRKLLVIDDRTCFLGSLNVGDELVGVDPPWREVHAQIDGPAVLAARETFEADWLFVGGVPRDTDRPPVAAGEQIVQVFASGPTEQVSATERVLFAAISQARSEVLIATPYFVPSRPILAALESASLRGATVRIAIPGVGDMGIVQAASRHFVPWLRETGVSVLTLPRQMLHAKVAVIDGKIAIVGSANLDRRSFDLSFELNAIFLGGPAVARARASMLQVHAASEPCCPTPRALPGRLVDALARVLAPVL